MTLYGLTGGGGPAAPVPAAGGGASIRLLGRDAGLFVGRAGSWEPSAGAVRLTVAGPGGGGLPIPCVPPGVCLPPDVGIPAGLELRFDLELLNPSAPQVISPARPGWLLQLAEGGGCWPDTISLTRESPAFVALACSGACSGVL